MTITSEQLEGFRIPINTAGTEPMPMHQTSRMMCGTPRISFSVHGSPKGQPRPRAFACKRRGRMTARVYNADTAKGWKGAIALAARNVLPKSPMTGPIIVNVTYFMPRPKRLMRKISPDGLIPHTSKPDIDNLNKAVLDTLTRIGVWQDDSQVIGIMAMKYHCPKDGTPGARISIEEVAA